MENAQTRTWLTRYPLIPVAGRDAHSLEELGRYPVKFPSPIRSRMDLVSALNSGQGIPVPAASEDFSPSLAFCA
jgi:hypothetical protein